MKIIFSRAGVVVDNAKITIHGTSYPLGNISAYKADVSMKEVFDWVTALKYAFGTAAVLTALLSFLSDTMLTNFSGRAVFLIIVFVAILAAMRFWWGEPSEPAFDFSFLSLTSAGTTKHALIVRDNKDDLVFDVKKALDQALSEFSVR